MSRRLAELRVPELRAELERRNKERQGVKHVLQERLAQVRLRRPLDPPPPFPRPAFNIQLYTMFTLCECVQCDTADFCRSSYYRVGFERQGTSMAVFRRPSSRVSSFCRVRYVKARVCGFGVVSEATCLVFGSITPAVETK